MIQGEGYVLQIYAAVNYYERNKNKYLKGKRLYSLRSLLGKSSVVLLNIRQMPFYDKYQ